MHAQKQFPGPNRRHRHGFHPHVVDAAIHRSPHRRRNHRSLRAAFSPFQNRHHPSPYKKSRNHQNSRRGRRLACPAERSSASFLDFLTETPQSYLAAPPPNSAPPTNYSSPSPPSAPNTAASPKRQLKTAPHETVPTNPQCLQSQEFQTPTHPKSPSPPQTALREPPLPWPPPPLPYPLPPHHT